MVIFYITDNLYQFWLIFTFIFLVGQLKSINSYYFVMETYCSSALIHIKFQYWHVLFFQLTVDTGRCWINEMADTAYKLDIEEYTQRNDVKRTRGSLKAVMECVGHLKVLIADIYLCRTHECTVHLTEAILRLLDFLLLDSCLMSGLLI